MMKRLDDFSLFFVSCLLVDSCLSFNFAIADEETTNYSYEDVGCQPPTMCAAWLGCTQACENLMWEDVESSATVPDEFTIDDIRESCLFICDDQYLQEDVNECHCESCNSACSMNEHDSTCH